MYAVLAYLTSYLCKPDHTLSELMRKAVKEVNEAGVGDKLRAIGNVFITAREVSFQESTYHLLSHPFRRSNVDVQYIATGPKKQRTRVLKPRAVLEKMDDDDNDVFAVGPIEKYENRPDVLEKMCLADFITNYRHKSATDADSVEENTIEGYFKTVVGYTINNDDDNGILINKAPSVIRLKNDLGEMKKRIRPCVPRTHKVSKDSAPEEYYMILLQLYWPWRDEIDLKHSDGTYTSKFNEVKDVIDDTISRFERYDQITEEDLENGYTISSEEESEIETSEIDSDNEDDLSFFNPENLDIVDPNDFQATGATCKITRKCMEDKEYWELYTRLNDDQRFLFNFVMRQTQEQLHFESNNVTCPEPYFVFLSGGGGVGKTYTVKGLIEYIRRNLQFRGQNTDEQPSIFVCASTGTAAVRIKGQTLHSAMTIPREQNATTKPSDDQLGKLQKNAIT